MLRSESLRLLVIMVLLLAHSRGNGLWCLAANPVSKIVGRTTNDRDADLLRALIGLGRFDDALDLCRWQSVDLDRSSDEAAKWEIRKSEVLTARQMGSDAFGDLELAEVQLPVSELLRSYPDHRRRLFLGSQLLTSERFYAFHSVLRAAVSPRNDQIRELATRRLLTAMTHVLSLSKEVQERRSQLESDRTASSRGLIADLRRIEQELQVNLVSLALVQTDLFARESADCIAAATKAEQVADDAITRLPAGTEARKEVERLRVEAIFRASRFERCDALLVELVQRFEQSLPPKLQALRVRLRIAQGRMTEAGHLLREFFGDVPESAPKALEMDLARLEFLLVTNASNGVGDWLDAIQRRGGAFARRRAEAVSLSYLHSTGQSKATVDPSLVAALGQDLLRRGYPGRAGDWLAAAAVVETDPDRAMKGVAEAAAALVAAKRVDDAVDLLRDVSLAKPTAKQAAATHLQAAMLISRMDNSGADALARLEAILQKNLQRWPNSKNSTSVRTWLQNILQSQKRYLEAAQIVSRVEPATIDSGLSQMIADAWLLALEQSAADLDKANGKETTDAFQTAMASLLKNDMMRSRYRLISATQLDRKALTALNEQGPDLSSTDSFIDSLIAFRREGKSITETPPPELLTQVESRMMADARQNADCRSRVTTILERWTDSSDVSVESAERSLWKGDVEGAIDRLRTVREKSSNPQASTRQAATILGASPDKKAQQAGVQLWDKLASGLPQGSRQWHEAKLSAIKLMQQIGDDQEAYRRARFVLLTQSNIDEDLRRQYQLVKQP